jgi:hypothetical protein
MASALAAGEAKPERDETISVKRSKYPVKPSIPALLHMRGGQWTQFSRSQRIFQIKVIITQCPDSLVLFIRNFYNAKVLG